MKCPHCTETALIMNDRQGVEIDYCPQCRGVSPRRPKVHRRGSLNLGRL